MRKEQKKPQLGDFVFTKEEKKNLTHFSLFVVSLLLTAILIAAIMKEIGKEDEEEPDMKIEDLFTQALVSGDNNSYEFDMMVLITNRADTIAPNVRVEIASIDNSAKLTYDKSNQSSFNIPAKFTKEVVVHLKVPRVAAHKMYLMVFVDDILKIKGYSIVSTEGSAVKRDFRVTYTREESDDDDDDNIVLAFHLLLLLVIPLLVIESIVVISLIKKETLLSALKKCVRRMALKLEGRSQKEKM